MSELALQMTAVITCTLITGIVAGWWAYYFMRREELVKCRYELAGLRRNYSETLEENRQLHIQLKAVESQLPKPRSMNEDSTNHGKYIALRKALEKSRQQITQLTDDLSGRDKRIEQLTQLHKQQAVKLKTCQQQLTPLGSSKSSPAHTTSLMQAAPVQDNLQQLNGVSSTIEQQLNALGIQSFQQLAELSNHDLERYQRLLKLPLKALKQWRSVALEQPPALALEHRQSGQL